MYDGSNGNEFPGKKLTEITLVNLEKQVTLTQLSADCIGLYGAEPKGDGKLYMLFIFRYLVIYVLFKKKN